MKKKLFLMAALAMMMSLLSAGDIYLYFIRGDIESMLRNTQFVISDYMNLANAATAPGLSRQQEEMEEKEGTGLVYFEAPVETIITPTSFHVKLPLSYRRNNLKFETAIPYYIKREMEYEAGAKSASGLGDISLAASYSMFTKNVFNTVSVNVKLPTGDADNLVDGYLVPLGTGSTDIIIANSLLYYQPQYSIYGNLSFRVNTPYKRVAEIKHDNPDLGTDIIEYEITNGNLLIMNTALTYYLPFNLGAVAGLAVLYNGEGSQDRSITYGAGLPAEKETGLSANQDFMNIDFYPALAYTIYRFDLTMGVRIPLVTVRNEKNTEPDRTADFMLRLSRNLF